MQAQLVNSPDLLAISQSLDTEQFLVVGAKRTKRRKHTKKLEDMWPESIICEEFGAM